LSYDEFHAFTLGLAGAASLPVVADLTCSANLRTVVVFTPADVLRVLR